MIILLQGLQRGHKWRSKIRDSVFYLLHDCDVNNFLFLCFTLNAVCLQRWLQILSFSLCFFELKEQRSWSMPCSVPQSSLSASHLMCHMHTLWWWNLCHAHPDAPLRTHLLKYNQWLRLPCLCFEQNCQFSSFNKYEGIYTLLWWGEWHK